MSNAFILGLEPEECDGVYPRTSDGRCHGCGIVGEHPPRRRYAREVWVMHGVHGDVLLSKEQARASSPSIGDSVCRYVPAATAVREAWEAHGRGLVSARNVALQMAAETVSDEARRAYMNFADMMAFEIKRRGK